MHAILTISYKNLWRNKLRTTMTVLGAGVGLSLFVALMTIAQSMQGQVRHMLDSFEVDVVIKAGGAPNPLSSRIAVTDIDRLLEIEGVHSASGLVLGSKRLAWNHYFVLFGADAADPFMNRFPLVYGRVFSDSDKEIMIGSLLARKRRLKVEDTLSLGRHGDYRVAGIFNTGSRVLDGAAIMALPQAQVVLQRGDDLNMIAVRMAEGTTEKDLLPVIAERLDHLDVASGLEFAGQLRMFRTINDFSEAVAFIALIACCITVMDTLLMAISERTKEIGILMAIGWSRWQIVAIILGESIFICGLGSLVGLLVGTGFLWLSNSSQILGIGWIPIWPPPQIVGMALALGLVMGCLSALYPALVASRMLPARALRFE